MDTQGFDRFWARYPNHSSRKDAEKAWGQIVTSPQIEADVHRGLDWQIPHWQTLPWYHPPYAATYLRKERFRDEPQGTTQAPVMTRYASLGMHREIK